MPDIPPTVTPDNAEDAKRFLDDVIQKVSRDVGPEILQAGEDLLLGLAVIVICWAGLRTAFAGGPGKSAGLQAEGLRLSRGQTLAAARRPAGSPDPARR